MEIRKNCLSLILLILWYNLWYFGSVDRDSSVGIATGYRLDVPEIESHCGLNFPHPSRPVPGHTLLYNCYRVWFPGVKRPGRVADHPHPSSAEIKEKVVTPLCLLWAFMACYRATFTVNFYLYFLSLQYIFPETCLLTPGFPIYRFTLNSAICRLLTPLRCLYDNCICLRLRCMQQHSW